MRDARKVLGRDEIRKVKDDVVVADVEIKEAVLAALVAQRAAHDAVVGGAMQQHGYGLDPIDLLGRHNAVGVDVLPHDAADRRELVKACAVVLSAKTATRRLVAATAYRRRLRRDRLLAAGTTLCRRPDALQKLVKQTLNKSATNR